MEKPNLFKKGQVANPHGRPKGSRNKLGEDFIAALAADFEKHGAETLATVRKEDPSAYVKVVASILPKEMTIKRPENELSDEQLAALIGFIEGQLATATGGSGSADSAKPAGALPTLQ